MDEERVKLKYLKLGYLREDPSLKNKEELVRFLMMDKGELEAETSEIPSSEALHEKIGDPTANE